MVVQRDTYFNSRLIITEVCKPTKLTDVGATGPKLRTQSGHALKCLQANHHIHNNQEKYTKTQI